MSQKDNLIQLIKQQIGVERDYAKHLAEVKDKVGIAAARLLLLEMHLNAEKHATILTDMLEIIKKAPPGVSTWDYKLEEYSDVALMRKEFERHVEKEDSTLARLKEELKRKNDRGLDLLFANIDEDEKRHYKILQAIIEELFVK
jgi:rubrerythrin